MNIPRPNNLDLGELEIILGALPDRRQPTAEERNCIWRVAVESLNQAVADGTEPVMAKRDLASWLFDQVPGLCQSVPAVIRSLERKYARWQTGQAFDHRQQANKERSTPPLSKADLTQLVDRAVNFHSGDTDPAWADCVRLKKFSPEVLAAYPLPSRRRPRCPRPIREQARAWIAQAGEYYRAPRNARFTGAHIRQNYKNVFAGDIHSSDDVTLPVYYYLPDGEDWFTLTRGQFLPMIDVRSKKILDFVLIDGKSYNAFAIRSLIRRVCNRFGLPHRGWHFENGIWKNSRLLGNAKRGHSLLAIRENFASRLGLRLRHSLPGNHRGKGHIENVIGLLQNLMEGEPGYVGRNEMVEKYERVQRRKLDVESRRVHPAEAGFYSAEEWVDRLHKICREYNLKPQDSRIIGGDHAEYSCPEDAFENYQRRNEAGEIIPPVRLPAEQEYLLGEHMQAVKVTVNGIRFDFGKQPFRYQSLELMAFQGSCLNASFDPDNPKEIIVSDLKRNRFLAVPQVEMVDAAASQDILAPACKKMAELNQYARARYSELPTKFMPPRRPVLVDSEAKEIGRKRIEARADLGLGRAREEKRDATEDAAFLARREAAVNAAFSNPLDFV